MKAINIEWDLSDDDYEGDIDDIDLPAEIEIPEGTTDEEEISDFLSNETGFCHRGFDLKD